MNRLWQIVFRAAYLLAHGYWFVARPSTKGAYVAVWVNDRVLVIRNSYKRVFSLPAGGVDRSETFRAAAARELCEEVGVCIAETDLTEFGTYQCFEEYKHDTTVVFELQLDCEPTLSPDNREVVCAEFADLDEVQQLPLSETLRKYLIDAMAQRSQRCPDSVSTSQFADACPR
ncbi:MAG: NUDIX hydrolase [Fuerstiella sp.]